jgi:hypothetical protein
MSSIDIKSLVAPYDDINFDNDDLDEHECICAICLSILKIPFETGVCCHTFCKSCIQKVGENGSIVACPSCQEPFNKSNIKFSFIRFKTIEMLEYTCSKKDCKKKFTVGTKYRNILNHLEEHYICKDAGTLEYMPFIDEDDSIVESIIWTIKIDEYRKEYDKLKENHFAKENNINIKSLKFNLNNIEWNLSAYPTGSSAWKQRDFLNNYTKKTNGFSLFLVKDFIKDLSNPSVHFTFTIISPILSIPSYKISGTHIFTKEIGDRGFFVMMSAEEIDKYIDDTGNIRIQVTVIDTAIINARKDKQEELVNQKKLNEIEKQKMDKEKAYALYKEKLNEIEKQKMDKEKAYALYKEKLNALHKKGKDHIIIDPELHILGAYVRSERKLSEKLEKDKRKKRAMERHAANQYGYGYGYPYY